MQHWAWLTDELAKHANRDAPFWQAMSLVVDQLEGMLQGYNTRAATREGQQLGLHHISLQEWLALNTMGACHSCLPAGLCGRMSHTCVPVTGLHCWGVHGSEHGRCHKTGRVELESPGSCSSTSSLQERLLPASCTFPAHVPHR